MSDTSAGPEEEKPLITNVSTAPKGDVDADLMRYLEVLTGEEQSLGLPDKLSYDAGEILQPQWRDADSEHIGLTDDQVQKRQMQFGLNEIPKHEKNLFLALMHELFCEPMPIVVWTAIIIEVVMTFVEWPGDHATSSLIDVFVLLMLQFLNVVVGFMEEMEAKASMDELQNSLPVTVKVVRYTKNLNGKVESVTSPLEAKALVPGDIICLEPGEAIPADCKMLMNQKTIMVDNSSLTGEAIAVEAKGGELLWMGSTIESGAPEAIVVNTGATTKIGLMDKMLTEETMGNFEKTLQDLLVCLVSIGFSITLIVFLYIQIGTPKETFGRALSFSVVLLIASIPIALKVVCTVTLSLGANQLAEDGAIVRKIEAIEALAGVTVLCSDKTGTLTTGQMQLQDDWHEDGKGTLAFATPTDSYHKGEKCTPKMILEMAVLSAKYEIWDDTVEPAMNKFDAIDTMLMGWGGIDKKETRATYDRAKIKDTNSTDYDPFDSESKHTKSQMEHIGKEATCNYGENGCKFRVAKGATKEIFEMCRKNNAKDEKEYNEQIANYAAKGIRCLAIAKSENVELTADGSTQGWFLVGLFTFSDPPRSDSAAVIQRANEFGVKVKMITGDVPLIAKETCKLLGMGHDVHGPEDFEATPILELIDAVDLGEKYGDMVNAADGFAGVLPEQKYLIVKALQQKGHLVCMCGDGVNDAPALKRADVGIAVQGAKAPAQDASKIVLTQPGLSTIVKAIVISRKIFTRMQNFVIYRVACTEQLLFFFLISCLCYNPKDDYMPDDWAARGQDPDDWEEYFFIPVLAIVSITLLNDGTIISVAYDNVEASLQPQYWDLKMLYWTSSVIGFVALVSSIVLLDMALDGADDSGGLAVFGLGGLDFGEIQTLMYLKMSLSDYGSVFNARTKGWMWSRAPDKVVVYAALFAVSCATFLAFTWPFGAGMKTIDAKTIAFVWAWSILWVIIQDAAKVLNYQLMAKLGYVKDLGTIDESTVLTGESYASATRAGDREYLGRPQGEPGEERIGLCPRSCCPCLAPDESLRNGFIQLGRQEDPAFWDRFKIRLRQLQAKRMKMHSSTMDPEPKPDVEAQ
jgi:H+-transporting ATPase